jgi:hypothetical protein
MKTLITRSIGILPIILSGSALLAFWQPSFAKTAPTSQSKPRIEVCFVLDTTGSMGGLIEGAKQKIWSIANEMISAQPTPELKLGLIGYRDRGDEYVVKSFSLTTTSMPFTDICASSRPVAVAIHRRAWTRRLPKQFTRCLEQRQQSPEDHLSGRRRAAAHGLSERPESIRIFAGKQRKRISSLIPFNVVRWLRPNRSGRRSRNCRKAVMWAFRNRATLRWFQRRWTRS